MLNNVNEICKNDGVMMCWKLLIFNDVLILINSIIIMCVMLMC